MADDEADTVLYEDKFITVTRSGLLIRRYHFPTFASRTLEPASIARVWRGTDAELGLNFWRKKSWGYAFSSTWWALRNGREFDKDDLRNIVVQTNDGGMHGFSVENPEQAYDAIMSIAALAAR